MTTKAVKRLSTELKDIIATPPPLADARPDENSILKWVFVLEGAPDTPYHGGEYLGELIFPEQYPFKPPTIKMLTPSGRFKTHTRLCFSMSDFHPEEWSPMWGVRQILIGLNSFMNEEASTFGSITTSDAAKRNFAQQSHAYNVELPVYQQLFPMRYDATTQRLAEARQRANQHDGASRHPDGGGAGAVAANAGIAFMLLRRVRYLFSSWQGVGLAAGLSLAGALLLSHVGPQVLGVGPLGDMPSTSAHHTASSM